MHIPIFLLFVIAEQPLVQLISLRGSRSTSFESNQTSVRDFWLFLQ